MRFQKSRPFLRRETAEDIERDIELARYGREMWSRTGGNGDLAERFEPHSGGAKSFKGQLSESLEDAITVEDKLAVVEYFVRRRMRRGEKRHVAEKHVLKLLSELKDEGVID